MCVRVCVCMKEREVDGGSDDHVVVAAKVDAALLLPSTFTDVVSDGMYVVRKTANRLVFLTPVIEGVPPDSGSDDSS